jgi:hypothetical protein
MIRIVVAASLAFGAISLLIACTPSAGQQNSEARPKPVATNICDLQTRPEKFDQTFVVVDATVKGDGIENQLLYNEYCPNSAVDFRYGKDFSRSAAADAINQALYNSIYHGRDKKIHGRFLGFFSFKAGEMHPARLSVEAVSGLTVQQLSLNEIE